MTTLSLTPTTRSRRRRPVAAGAVALSSMLLLAACGVSGTQTAASSTASARTYSNMSEWTHAEVTCLREHGVDATDPETHQGQLLPEGSNTNEAVAKAMTECEAIVGAPPGASAGDDTGSGAGNTDKVALARCLRKAGVDVADPKPDGTMFMPLNIPADVMKSCTEEAAK